MGMTEGDIVGQAVMPDRVKEFISKGLLAEFHLQEIIQLSAADNLSPWLTTSQAWEELAEKAVRDRAKNGSKSRKQSKRLFECSDCRQLLAAKLTAILSVKRV